MNVTCSMGRPALSSGDMTDDPTTTCSMCGRARKLTFHHLIPRTLHSNKWFQKNYSREEMAVGIDICGDCHGAIHKIVPSAKELGRDYNTREKLLGHPEIANFVSWVRKRRGKQRYRTR